MGGTFEAHTKGTGSQIMKKQGWSDGDALGNPDRKGRKSPVTVKGQTNSDKSGFGYEKYFVQEKQPNERIEQNTGFQIELSNRFSPLEESEENTVIPLLRPPKRKREAEESKATGGQDHEVEEQPENSDVEDAPKNKNINLKIEIANEKGNEELEETRWARKRRSNKSKASKMMEAQIDEALDRLSSSGSEEEMDQDTDEMFTNRLSNLLDASTQAECSQEEERTEGQTIRETIIIGSKHGTDRSKEQKEQGEKYQIVIGSQDGTDRAEERKEQIQEKQIKIGSKHGTDGAEGQSEQAEKYLVETGSKHGTDRAKERREQIQEKQIKIGSKHGTDREQEQREETEKYQVEIGSKHGTDGEKERKEQVQEKQIKIGSKHGADRAEERR